MQHTTSLIAFLAICFAAAASGATFQPREWYDRLRKPSWQPPRWAFPTVWSVLYLMIATSGWLAWTRSDPATAPAAFTCYAVQLVLNAAWSPIFFGLRRIDLAFIVSLAMIGAIAATIWQFAPIDRAAAWLLVPYLAWVCVAALLNWSVWRLNPGPI